MKKSIFKITTLLLLLCAAVCSVVGIAACSSAEPIVGTWVATCANSHYTDSGEVINYYLTATTSGAQVTSVRKETDGTSYIKERNTAPWISYKDYEGDYAANLILGGYDGSDPYECVITMTGDDTFELIEYYTDSQTYTYTFTRTTMTLDEWKALYS